MTATRAQARELLYSLASYDPETSYLYGDIDLIVAALDAARESCEETWRQAYEELHELFTSMESQIAAAKIDGMKEAVEIAREIVSEGEPCPVCEVVADHITARAKKKP